MDFANCEYGDEDEERGDETDDETRDAVLECGIATQSCIQLTIGASPSHPSDEPVRETSKRNQWDRIHKEDDRALLK